MSIHNFAMSNVAGASAQGGGFYPYLIDQSLRFDGTSSYLNFTPSSSTAGTFTISFWVKRTKLGVAEYIFYSGAVNQRGGFGFDANDEFFIGPFNSSGANANLFSDMKFRDVGSWYHIVIEANAITYSNLATAMNIYVNGEEITARNTQLSTPTGGDRINDTQAKFIGALTPSPSQYTPSYLAEWHWVDGTALDHTNFGETINGIWVPKEYTGSHGSAGYYLPFDDSSAIGDDKSANTNDWTANNLSAHDVVPDSPTNNFATLNPLDNYNTGATLSEGNLKWSIGGADGASRSTYVMTAGKWYVEFLSNNDYIGVVSGNANITNMNGTQTVYYAQDGTKRVNGSSSSYGASYSNGDIIGIALDLDASPQTVTFYKNNSSQGSLNLTDVGNEGYSVSCGSGSGSTNATANFGQDSTFAGATTAGGNNDENGIGDFKYAVPSGFLALCSANLPEPTIGPNSTTQADDYFNTVLYSATAGAAGSVTGYGFAPDWLWTKARNATQSHQLFDNVRGDNNIIYSNLTNAESAQAAGYFTLEADGFNYGTSTFTSNTYVGWGWKAGGTAVSNTDGSITSQVSANPTAGFSIVSYTGTGTSGTYGHGLGVAPNMILTKDRTDPAAWAVYVSDIGTGKYLELEQTDGTTTAAAIYPSVSSTTIGVGVQGDGSITNTSGDNYISYCFTDIDGFSKIGSYTGNGNADGAFVYTGFRPAWILIKSTSGSTDWMIYDSKRLGYNPNNNPQRNVSAAEQTDDDIDFLSNGFKLRRSSPNFNAATHIYLALAENPFKYSNAR